ncbi:membrane protein [Oscillospiraceae bacterium]|nr:membrane protein [Oscillospiraceae bacterium]
MEEKTKKALIPAWIGVACVWFGIHCGPGAASGNQTVSYFVRYGLWSLIMPLVAMALLGLGLYYAMEFSRRTKAVDFKDFANKLFDPYHKIFANLFEFSFVGTVGLSGGACVATASTLFHDYFGAPVWLGIVAIVFCTIFFSIYGESLVRAASTGMSVIIFVAIFAVVIAGITNNGGIAPSFTGRSLSDANGGAALWRSILYAAFQSTGVFGGCIAVVHGLKNRSEVKKSIIFGIALNSLFLIVVALMLLGYPEAIQDTLPNYWVITRVGAPVLVACYVMVVFFACCTNTISFSNALSGRYGRFFKFKNPKVTKLIIAIIMLVYVSAFSGFGLNKLVGTGFQYLGYFCIVTLLIPTIFVGRRRIKKMDAADAAGVS